VLAHDASADGEFYYSVKTSGVYCRPSCNARPANPESVAFHASGEEALTAGFRACKRCKPDLFKQRTEVQTMSDREIIHYVTVQLKFGPALVAQSGKGVAAVLLGDEPAAMFADLQDIFPNACLEEGEGVMDKTAAKVARYIDDPRGKIDVPLDIRGTDFEKKVWDTLCRIPAGKTMSYSRIAHTINIPGASRAVGSACGKNVLAVLIPCHRAVRSDGKISGYRWGPDLKRVILSMEAT
jgi:AraC family transcriptional regulator of adaptative response/methylated-DNA-[protein]-cysteine methyltransferase